MTLAELGLDAWRDLPAAQQPNWPDPVRLAEVSTTLAALPPLVVATEVDQLRERLAAVARGEAFLLQGGDCSESFEDCESAAIASKLKMPPIGLYDTQIQNALTTQLTNVEVKGTSPDKAFKDALAAIKQVTG